VRSAALACALAAALAACGSSSVTSLRAGGDAQRRSTTQSPIAHVVLVIQENRTFNDFFATFKGADGTTTGVVAPNPACGISSQETIPLRKAGLITRLHGVPHDLNHGYKAYAAARDDGAMDGFDTVDFGDGSPECTFPYQYTNPKQIGPYWQMAGEYTLAEHMFTTQGSSSFTAHQDLIAGDTLITPTRALIDLPSCAGSKCIWGCDAPPGTRTSLISHDDVYRGGAGPFPCLTYPTLRDLLDAKDVSWRYYVPQMCCTEYGKLMSAFDAIKAVRYGSEWTDGHISSPQTNIFNDVANHQLQAVSWIMPDENDSDHPGTDSDTGPSWVADIVNAIGESQYYWNSTAIVILWDDWGGLYDNLNPEQKGFGGLGFRVPAIVVSPYARPRYISPTEYEFGSVLKFIEDNWSLGTLKRSDARSASLIDCFNYAQPPIPFSPISSKYSQAFFLHKKPSYLPVDTDL
jgi:phospholipase C